jgi:hypothetical protein
MKMYLGALLLSVLAIGCSDKDKDSASEAAGLVNSAYNLSGGTCVHLTFPVAIPKDQLDASQKVGTCPASATVSTFTAPTVKACPSFKTDNGATYAITFYSKDIDSEGKVFDVTAEDATTRCDVMKDAITQAQ